VIWNGPVGVTEVKDFAAGSLALAGAIVALPGEISIIGGGDTAAFIDEAGRHDQFTWVSTGGGASLELMSGKALPGVEALLDK
jgi:phosphoglycerate kinase